MENTTNGSTTYALSHAFLGTSFVIVQGATPPAQGSVPEVFRLRTPEAKEKFCLETLKSGDKLLLDMGGAGDKVALIAANRGVEVHRIPTFRVGNNNDCYEVVEQTGWKLEQEKPYGEETGAELTDRKFRAAAIASLFDLNPESFYAYLEPEQAVLRIKVLYRSYRLMQKNLLGSYLRLLSVYKDRYLLRAAESNQDDVKTSGRDVVSARNVVFIFKALLNEIPENEREAFGAKLGLVELESKKTIPRKVVAGMMKSLVEKLLESEVFSPFLKVMKETKKEIEKLLKSIVIYSQVFEPIPGVGPLIAARFLANIVDIRRFETLPALKAYAGYHHFDDGSRARRRAGTVSNWSPELKQAVYLWTEQTLKMPKSPWRTRLDQRRAYELFKLLSDRQLKAYTENCDVDILPLSFQQRVVKSTNDMTVADLTELLAHVDTLTKRAGIKVHKDEEEEEAEENGEVAAAKDPVLAKLVRGLKMQALQKAKRWLGQQILKHIFKSWRKALGLSEFPEQATDPSQN